MASLPLFSLTDVPRKSAECSAAEASLHVNILPSRSWAHFIDVGRITGTELTLPSHDIWWRWAGDIREAP